MLGVETLTFLVNIKLDFCIIKWTPIIRFLNTLFIESQFRNKITYLNNRMKQEGYKEVDLSE